MASVEAPAPRDYGKETAETLRAQIDLAPEKYAAEAKYAPQYQALQLGLLKSATPELLQLYKEQIAPTMGEVEAAARSRSRAGDIADIGEDQHRQALIDELVDRLRRCGRPGIGRWCD